MDPSAKANSGLLLGSAISHQIAKQTGNGLRFYPGKRAVELFLPPWSCRDGPWVLQDDGPRSLFP